MYVGLFGCVGSGGTVQNLNVSGTIDSSSSEARTGGIAGNLDGGAVTNCSFSGNITMEGSRYLGGIVGYAANKSTVANCYNSAKVNFTRTSDTDYTGGIAGGVDASTVKNCFNEGSVTGDSNAGGIAGNLSNGSTIVDCFNSGKIEATHEGGIVGWHFEGTADNCGWLTGTATKGKGGGFGSDDAINAESVSDINSVVTSLSASMDKDEIEVGKTGTITLKLAPATDGFSAHSGAVKGMNAEGYDEALVTVEKDEANGTFTVTGVAEGSTEITVTATLYATKFSNPTEYVDGDGENYVFTFPVTVVAATQSNDSSSGSGSTGGGGGGGCSAGFGALTLLAAVPLLFRRKK